MACPTRTTFSPAAGAMAIAIASRPVTSPAVAQAERGKVADVGHLLQRCSLHAVNPALKRITHQNHFLAGEPEAVRGER
jgi:hypothetical protein